MTFQNPYFLLLLVFAILPFIVKKHSSSFKFSSFTILPKDRVSSSADFLSKLILSLTIIALALGVSGIEIKKEQDIYSVPSWKTGAQIVYIVDASGSMATGEFDDGKLKLEAAFDILEKFILHRNNDYSALIIFGDGPVLIYPPNFNKKEKGAPMIIESMRMLKNSQINLGYTTLDLTIAKAISLFNKEKTTYDKAIVFLSDGEGEINRNKRIELSFWLEKFNAKFYWIRIASDEQSSADGDMRDLLGSLGSLGKIFQGNTPKEIEKALSEIDKLEKGLLECKEQRIIAHQLDKLFYFSACLGLIFSTLFIFFSITAAEGQKNE